MKDDPVFRSFAGFSLGSGAKAFLRVAGVLLVGAQDAQALPSFARQTGQQCAACHNGFPELTPYGRQFKINGYTFSNGDAPTFPLAALIISSFTHTAEPADAPPAPGTTRNDNYGVDAANFFYAGKITSNVGAYLQGFYDVRAHAFALFNSDFRYADTAHFFGKAATIGLTVNNNPGLTDPWNTAQSFWYYPYETSHWVAQPAASTAIQGRYAQQVEGATAYVSWDQWVYAAAGAYEGLDAKTLNSLGINTRGTSLIADPAPYWRVALEPAWGNNTLEFGTFGMDMSVDPLRDATAGTDRTVDVGVDSQYQYLADRYSLSLIGSYIWEDSSLDASRALHFSSNSRDNLRAVNVKVTYAYDQTYYANLGPFRTYGSRDQALYGSAGAANGSPDTAGWVGELDYYPFNRGGPAFWRQLGLKFGLQYTYYTRFDGATTNYDGMGRSASANNTLFLYTWILF